MKKILFGFTGIMIVFAIVATSARALFVGTANINNVAISTGNASLEFSPDNNTWSKNFTFGAWPDQNITPGYQNFATFWMKNTSTSNISLSLSARLTAAQGDWNELSNILKVWVGKDDGATGAGYHALAVWNETTPHDLNIIIPKGQSQRMRIYLQVPEDAGNEIADKDLHTDWEINGTQIP